jgi:hypothetical protein
MNRLLGIFAGLIAIALPALAQDVARCSALSNMANARLQTVSWQQDRDDDRQQGNQNRDRNRGWYGNSRRGYHGVLAPEWQQKFDSYYQRWLQYRATNNQDEVASMEKRMRDIMVNYRIPATAPFDQVASPGIGGNAGYNGQAGGNGGYGQWQGRLSADDQSRFDSYYSRWLEYRRTNNQSEVASMENRMRDVMSHNNIPSNVPFDQIASNGGQDYNSRYGQWQGRLSADDQSRFDSYYSRWLDYRRTNNRDEIVSMENRMRDVMSHNNIPSDVPFDQIASPR